MPRIIDITKPLQNGLTVWPGDTEFDLRKVWDMTKGDSCNVGAVTMSLHSGTHTDAPKHFLKDAKGIDEVDLVKYIGPALVVEFSGVDLIRTEHIASLPAQPIARLLLKTDTANQSEFNPDFAYFDPAAAQLLADRSIELIGIDTPSVDKADSTLFESHKIFASHDIAIIENLVLSDVSPGLYQLIAMPLRFVSMDASPVRAILIDENN